MFQKKKKEPATTGRVEKAARFYCILQLCIVFTVLCWHLGYPFLGEIYEIKQEKQLYDFVFEEVNMPYFDQLPSRDRLRLESGAAYWKKQLEKSFATKLKASVRHMNYYMPRLELAWVVLSIIVCIMVLRQSEGYSRAVWLLPFLAVAFAYENISWGTSTVANADAKLYPTESQLVAKYRPEGLSANPLDHPAELTVLWEKYLEKDWGKGDLKRGEFVFTVARIKEREANPSPISKRTNERQSIFWLLLYIAWNTFLALKVSKYKPLQVVHTDAPKVAH
ncbi:MAG: hypothetical protein WC222_07680 [Parachlamydiales bacterium]|jgi:hypothetical protein